MVRVNMPYYTCDMCGSTKDVKKVSITIDGAKATGDLCSAHRKPVEQVVARFATSRGPVAHIPTVPYETFVRQAAQARGTRKGGSSSETPLAASESDTVHDEVGSSSGEAGSSPETHTTARRRGK